MSANVSVSTLTAGATGYQPRQELMEAHYRRDVTLTVEIPLVGVSGGKDSKRGLVPPLLIRESQSE